jgi:hypothetical protein
MLRVRPEEQNHDGVFGDVMSGVGMKNGVVHEGLMHDEVINAADRHAQHERPAIHQLLFFLIEFDVIFTAQLQKFWRWRQF